MSTENDLLIHLDIPDDLFLEIAKQAHAENLTINEMINNILREYIEYAEITACDNTVCNDIISSEDFIQTSELTDFELEEIFIEAIVSNFTEPSEENVKNLVHAYYDWFTEYAGDSSVTDIYNEASKRYIKRLK